MNFDKNSITKFLDGVHPFNDEYSQKLWSHPVIAAMAMDIEALYIQNEAAAKALTRYRKVIGRQRGLMFVSSVAVLGYAVYVTDKKRKAEGKKPLSDTFKETARGY